MEIILLERVPHLGQMGDVLRVKNGHARNFLIPQGKAMRATTENRALYEKQKTNLEAKNKQLVGESRIIAEKLEGTHLTLIRAASETGVLYGSVSRRDLADAITKKGFAIDRRQINLATPFKNVGVHSLSVSVHPEIDVTVFVNIAKTEEEAERQARGEKADAPQRNDVADLGLEIGAALNDDDLLN